MANHNHCITPGDTMGDLECFSCRKVSSSLEGELQLKRGNINPAELHASRTIDLI